MRTPPVPDDRPDAEIRRRSPPRDRPTPLLRALASAATANAFGVIVLGSIVRVSESGMGCISWPLCNGHIGPIDSFHPLLEQVHRYAVSLLVVLVVATLVLALREAGRFVSRAALVAALLLLVQALLGAITVWTHNAPVTVALHMCFAELLLGTLVAVLVGVWRGARGSEGVFAASRSLLDAAPGTAPARAAPGKHPGMLAVWAVLAMLAVFASGTAVADGGASGACRSWPVCRPDGHPAHLVAIQYVHRGMVLLLSVLLVALVLRAWRSWRGLLARGLAAGVAVLLAAQVAAGAVDAVMGAPEVAQDVHLGLASALWSCLVALVVLAWSASRPALSPPTLIEPLPASRRGRTPAP